MSLRPPLTSALSVEEFAAWYWLKEELVAFCREHGISSVGLKREIEARIADRLAGKRVRKPASAKRRHGRVPREFTLETVIGEGWRCGPALGGFFKRVLGNGFHFNAEMRDFLHHGSGKTLGDAVLCYQHSVRPGRQKPAIPEQLEYNRHFREYFAKNPGATREDAIAAWWAHRTVRRQP